MVIRFPRKIAIGREENAAAWNEIPEWMKRKTPHGMDGSKRNREIFCWLVRPFQWTKSYHLSHFTRNYDAQRSIPLPLFLETSNISTVLPLGMLIVLHAIPWSSYACCSIESVYNWRWNAFSFILPGPWSWTVCRYREQGTTMPLDGPFFDELTFPSVFAKSIAKFGEGYELGLLLPLNRFYCGTSHSFPRTTSMSLLSLQLFVLCNAIAAAAGQTAPPPPATARE